MSFFVDVSLLYVLFHSMILFDFPFNKNVKQTEPSHVGDKANNGSFNDMRLSIH